MEAVAGVLAEHVFECRLEAERGLQRVGRAEHADLAEVHQRDAVTEQVCAFRARESDRVLESNGRAERMRARIADLERETQELHCKLDLEKHVARLDPLTGVANRKSYDERFALEIGRRAAGDTPLVMQLWDIDNFKMINDSYGHRAGDRVLQSVAACFKSSLRSSDFVARIGGEEFAVLLNGLKAAEAMNSTMP